MDGRDPWTPEEVFRLLSRGFRSAGEICSSLRPCHAGEARNTPSGFGDASRLNRTRPRGLLAAHWQQTRFFATVRLMTRKPLVLVTADVDRRGVEFGDPSLSLSWAYGRALEQAGALPLALPPVSEESTLVQLVARCDGVLLTGGYDVNPGLYRSRVSPILQRTLKLTPDGGQRDWAELLIIREVFRQRKPLLAICRGHQLLNVALGGTLLLDLPTQRPNGLAHYQSRRKNDVAHDVQLTPGSLLHSITGTQVLGVNSTHHQAVDRVAGLLQVAATSSDGVIEGLELAGRYRHALPFLLSVQFHPERLHDRYPGHRAIFTAFVQACAANGNRML